MQADGFLSEFFDPWVPLPLSLPPPLYFSPILTKHHGYRVSSILVCRFMLALRRFDTSAMSTTHLGPSSESRVRDHGTASTVLQFAAQPSASLPTFIASFAQPVHVDSSLSGGDSDDEYEWREMDVVPSGPAPETPSYENTAPVY